MMSPNELSHPLKSRSMGFAEAPPVNIRGTNLWRSVLRATVACALGLAVLASAPRAGMADPFIWDDDDDGLDDRMETVNLLGFQFSFVNADSLLEQRFDVSRIAGDLVYGVYVVYDAPPTPGDLLALGALGMPVLHRFEGIPAVRSVATFVQADLARGLPGVKRIETISLLHGLSRDDVASMAVRDASAQVHPTWAVLGGGEGHGVIVAVLDSGVNDAADGGWPGHESLIGKVVGGATFLYGDSLLDTPRDGSSNPDDHGGPLTGGHATHVAGSIAGSGGESGYAAGVARGARLVDVKVLSDLGFGGGVAEALDWCIHNRSRDWGAGPEWMGIDVINLSLSSLDESDGNDVASRLAARAVELGMVVVASVGNEGASGIPSPAAGDGVLAVGAYDAQRTGAASDDVYATFGNRGPRASDGDADPLDELKPDLLAPGMAVLSADGDLGTEGAEYQRKSGTSMSAALVSGAVAVLRSDFPALTPARIAEVLRSTARPAISGAPACTPGPDPRWSCAAGWGAIDLAAARLELTQPERSQVRRLILDPAETLIEAGIWTARERGAAHFVLERAADIAGTPGAFAPLDSVPAAGDSSLADDGLQEYALTLAVPPGERGVPFWYRVAYSEAGARWNGPERLLTSPAGPPVARVEVRVVHNAYDHDVQGVIEWGGAVIASLNGPASLGSPTSTLNLPGSSAAVATDWVNGLSSLGNVALDFALDLPAESAGDFLPPSAERPWRLMVEEGGYANRSGRIEHFRVVWHAEGGDIVFEGGPAPALLVEGGSVELAIPNPVAGVPEVSGPRGLRVGPNPLRAGDVATFALDGRPAANVRIFDLAGREVGRSDSTSGRWRARDEGGSPLPAGIYFARAGTRSARVVVLAR